MTITSTPPPPASRRVLAVPSQVELRDRLEEAVIRDLLGPAGGPEEEIVEGTVRDRYLVGMLAPRRLRIQPEEDDAVEVEDGSSAEEGTSDTSAVAAPTMFPSAIGLSFCVAEGAAPLRITARWGRYRRSPSEGVQTETGKPRMVWKREPVEHVLDPITVVEGPMGPIPVGTNDRLAADVVVRDVVVRDVVVRGVAKRVPLGFVVSLFLVNVQDEPEELRDQAWVFQPELVVEAEDGSAIFRSRPRYELASADAGEEERLVAMAYRDRVEFAVGHGVSVHANPLEEDPRRATRVETRVVPSAEVLITDSPTAEDEPKLRNLVLDMKELAEAPCSASAPLNLTRWYKGITLAPHQNAGARQEGWVKRPVIVVPASIIWNGIAISAEPCPITGWASWAVGARPSPATRAPARASSTSTCSAASSSNTASSRPSSPGYWQPTRCAAMATSSNQSVMS